MLKRTANAALVVAVGFTVVVPTIAKAENQFKVNFMGENPSGKLKLGMGSFKTFNSEQATPRQAPAKFNAECPPTIRCVVSPAAYQNNNPSDPVDYGNYDKANRPADGMAINSIVIHDTEGSLKSTLEAFQNPAFYASAHYVIDADGTVYQTVPTKDVAWHAGNWWHNMHSIGIEHVGHSSLGGTEYTPAMYRSSAELVKWLAAKYQVPLDRQHIIGHDNVPGTTKETMTNMHTDPGPFWNWQNYMATLGAPVVPTAGMNSKLVTVAPIWPLNQQKVTDCQPVSPTCAAGSTQPSNFVYLRIAPSQSAALLTDPVLGQGTTALANNAARAFHGQEFAVADRQFDRGGVWYKVWYDGQLGWFYSPWNTPTGFPSSGKVLTPKPGLASVQVYGRPLPNKNEYPADFTPPSGSVPYPTPLPYKIPAGQQYAVTEGEVPNDHYFAWTYNASLPYDHTVFKGGERYLRLTYNGREAFVKAAEVEVK